MSGGSYNYAFSSLSDMIHDHRLTKGSALRRAFARHLVIVQDAMRAIEWVDSSDCGPGDEDEPIRACLGKHAELEEVIAMAKEAKEQLDSLLLRAVGGGE